MNNGGLPLPARRHRVAFHALIMKLDRRLAGRRLDDFNQTIPTIDGCGGLRIHLRAVTLSAMGLTRRRWELKRLNCGHAFRRTLR
jgi:hypothetical protein